MKTEEKKEKTKKKPTKSTKKTKQKIEKQTTKVKKSATKETKEIEEKKKFSLKEFLTSTKTLSVIFCLLLVLVIALFTLVLQKKQEKEKNPAANMVIPIYKESSGYHFSISAMALSKRKNYVFKVTNYKEKTINSKDVHYQITIDNPSDSNIKVLKGKEDKNLMTNNDKTTIDGGILSHEQKLEDTYYVTMTSHGKIKDNDYIRVEVALVDNNEN